MRYPEPLKKGDLIGICAPSSGVQGVFERRLDNAVTQLKALGYECIETSSVRNRHKLTSASASGRAEEFMTLYLNDKVKAIIPPWGGEFLIDMLPLLDFELIKALPPKWILGYSDTSTLMFALTLRCDMATAHGPCLMEFGCTPVDGSVLDALNCMESAEAFEQNSLKYYQKDWGDVNENPAVPYQLTEKVEWKRLGSEADCSFEGRMIGGCLDTICKLIGTPYAPVQDFISKYEQEGIIWYLESCEMNAADIYRTLWQMKMNGWFENCSGILFGRPEGYSDVRDFDLTDALSYPLGDLNIPVLYDVDIGHVPPQLTLINGVYAEVSYGSGRGGMLQRLIDKQKYFDGR